ncbi:hypothetical protein ACQKGL_21670, partial [Ensifer adhaerens]|uniref:hypothetical protein n=1 Tax=Ensifer adhaerens TaxID=106592 RepID=UPI003D00644F
NIQAIEIKHKCTLLINSVDLEHRKTGESAARIFDQAVKILMVASHGRNAPSERPSLHIENIGVSIVRY